MTEYTNGPAVAISNVAPLNAPRIGVDSGIDLNAVIPEFIVPVAVP